MIRNVRYCFVWDGATSTDFDALHSVHPSPAGIALLAGNTTRILESLFLGASR